MAKAQKAAKTAQPEGIYGYCMKTKTSNLMQDVTISIKSGKYIASGVDADDNKITKIMSKVQAEEAVENGWAEMVDEKPAKKVVPAKKK